MLAGMRTEELRYISLCLGLGVLIGLIGWLVWEYREIRPVREQALEVSTMEAGYEDTIHL